MESTHSAITLLKKKFSSRKRTLRKLKNDMKTAASEDAICPPRQLSEILIKQARHLQMLPDVAVKAIAVAEDRASDIKDLIGIISQDVMLTTNILSLSNSVLFGAGRPISNIQIAITRLGFRQTKNMILAASFTSMLKNMNWKTAQVRERLCKHSFMTAVVCTRLNTLFQLSMQGEEFTAGLIHDVGRSLLAVAIPDEFEKLDSLDFDENESTLDNEFQAIGTTHTEVGAWFLQRNHLPDELISVARYHHTPQDSSKYLRLVGLVAIADDLANHFQRQDPSPFNCSKSTSLKLLESLGVERARKLLQDSWGEVIDSSIEAVGQLSRM